MESIIKEILEIEQIPFNTITKATSGFTNLVYFVDDEYVIKMSNDEEIKKKLNKETSIYKNITLTCIPKYVASGNKKGFQYLIISKVKGKGLYSIWHTLSAKERKKCVTQIACILKQFNKQDYEFLSEEYQAKDWCNNIASELMAKVSALEDLNFNVKEIKDFIANDLLNLFKKNTLGLVYNDAHFDNFIYNDGELSLIDFYRVRVCPIDYEMLIFKTMCDNPCKFASEEDEEKVKAEDYCEIYNQFKAEYPEMFNDNNVEKRIKVYQFNYLMGQAIKCKDREWITELLDGFKKW